MGRRSKYPEEFRRDAAKLALDGGRSIRDVARELGVSHETLRNWIEALRRERRDGPIAVGGEERAELARLRRRVAELGLEKEVLREARGLLRPGDRPVPREQLYGFIAAENTTYPVRLLRRVLQVSTSAFYDWIHRGRPRISEGDLDDAYAANTLHNAWVEHRHTYGARRLTAEIGDRGRAWNRKKVARLMTVANIEGIHRRRRGKKRSRVGAGSIAPDLVKRQFAADHPDRLWGADISYLRTWEGFLYLAVIIDACTRRVVGWAIADHLRRELVLDALGMALHQRKPTVGLIHHSGHGVQYTSIDFGRTLRTSGVVASMGSIGDAFDNAMAESFFATLKEEMIYRRAWPTRHELEMEVFSYIEGFYNPLRRHSRLGNLSAAAYEHQLTTQTEVSS